MRLMIEKFWFLKKESSRDIFIANMREHTRARRKVSSIFLFLQTSAFFKFLLAQHDKGQDIKCPSRCRSDKVDLNEYTNIPSSTRWNCQDTEENFASLSSYNYNSSYNWS